MDHLKVKTALPCRQFFIWKNCFLSIILKLCMQDRKSIQSNETLILYVNRLNRQLHELIHCTKQHNLDLSDKYAAQITTSKHFYDVTAHTYIEDNCHDLNLKIIKGLSADMEDLTMPKGQKEAKDFFEYVIWCMKHDIC